MLSEIPLSLSLLQWQRGKSQKVSMLLDFSSSGIATENNKYMVSFLLTALQSSSSNTSDSPSRKPKARTVCYHIIPSFHPFSWEERAELGPLAVQAQGFRAHCA